MCTAIVWEKKNEEVGGIGFILEEINSGGKRWSKCRFTVEFLLLEVEI